MEIIDLRHGFVRQPFAAFKRRARKNKETSAHHAEKCEQGGDDLRHSPMEDGANDENSENI